MYIGVSTLKEKKKLSVAHQAITILSTPLDARRVVMSSATGLFVDRQAWTLQIVESCLSEPPFYIRVSHAESVAEVG